LKDAVPELVTMLKEPDPKYLFAMEGNVRP